MKQDDQEKQRQAVHDTQANGGESQPQIREAHELPIRKTGSGKKKLIIIASALIVAALVAAGVWYLFSIVNTPKSESEEATQPLTVRQLSLSATSELKGESITIPVSATFGGQTESGQLVYEFAAYQVSGMPFSNLPKNGSGTSYVSSAADAEANIKKIDQNLKDQGFTQKSTSVDDAAGALALQKGTMLVSYATYLSDTAVCALSRLSAEGTDKQLSGLGCADIADYTAVAQAVGSIHSAYVKGKQAPEASKLVYSLPDIKDGAGGEKRATLYQKDATKLSDTGIYYYYTTGNGSEWKFLAAAPKAMLDCAVFNTPEIKEAFRGAKCYENSDQVSEIK